ncbi:uncharacterized protein LOC108950290 isoform X2 [Ciona intestinalis]
MEIDSDSNSTKMAPKIKRTCLSAQSALSGKPNVEEVPLGAKLPMVPGSRLQLYTAGLGEKLHQPSCDFDRTYPSDVYISNEYRCLHDPHLRHYFVNRPDMTKRLRKRGFVTRENKVVCSLNEYNLYRQYLKHLSIEYFNKIYREKYEKELNRKRESTKKAIGERKQDPSNPITKRLEVAKSARYEMERARLIKRRRILRAAHAEREERVKKKEEEMQRRIKEEMKRESARERMKKVKLFRGQEERRLKEELMFYKHQEDFYRSKELEERKKLQAKEREMKLCDKYERKKRFHLMKMMELGKLLEEEEEVRKRSVQNWKDYFAKKLEKQQEKLRQIIKKERETRESANRKIEESLRARGWTGMDRCSTKPVQTGLCQPKKSFKKSKNSTYMTPNQLSALGFHRAVVPTDMLDLLWDRTSDFSCTSSDDGEEHAAGDAIPPAPSTSEQARLICDDAIAHGHAYHVVDGVVTSSNDVYQASSNIVQQTIGLSKEILLPMLRSYEEKTGSKISDADVPTTIRDLFNGVLELDEDEVPDLVNVGGTGKTVVKPGKKDSNVRFDFSNTELPLVGALGHRQHRPPTPKRRVQFSSSDDSIEGVDLDMSESQMVLEQTIKVLASKVVTQVFEASHLTLDKSDMEERVAHLAGSVVNEIIAFETSSEEKRSTSPSLSECSGSSSTISVFSEASLNKKISWLAKEMIKDVVYKEPMGAPSNDHSDTDGSVMQRASTASDLSVLALHVVRSALNAVNSGVDFSCVNEGALYEQIEPLINDLSSKLIEQVMKERQPGRTDLIKTDKHHFAELENKISKLAINIVSSVLQGNTTSASTSMTSLSSFTMETRVNEMTSGIVGAILNLKALLPSSYKPKSETNLCKDVKDMTVEDFILEIFSLKALTNAPRRLFKNLREGDIQRISQNLARKIVPDRDASSAFSSGIEDLAAAITDNAVKKVDQEASLWSEESSTPTIEHAMKKLAEAMVKETLQETSKISSDARSAVSSGLEDLATDAALTAIQRAENLSQESAVNSGASDLAGDVVSNAMLKAGDLGSSTDSAMSSGASIFAMDALKQSLQKLLLADSSTQSAVNSGLKHVSEDLIVESTALETALANAGSLGSSSRSAFSSGMSLLAEEIAKLTITEGRSLVHGEVESVVSSAVSQMVIDTLAARVLERIMENSSTNLYVPGNLDKLQSEVVKIVRSLVDARKR